METNDLTKKCKSFSQIAIKFSDRKTKAVGDNCIVSTIHRPTHLSLRANNRWTNLTARGTSTLQQETALHSFTASRQTKSSSF